ncbi:ParB/RepB/Spo0J family partition protein [Legionella sp. km772]|uniref:ParB/RepB/Spo0J family partition protein n=1 Tax=Legionella sp. km772 TaxID=2498111 RepID=UPI000F8DC5C8|nr:ParB/RepB/Spo0J family partition protein [Legionella sp. km772]RUR13074.1 ParB/RepB/Spo0J family partition protein [Legionella sp. km772]
MQNFCLSEAILERFKAAENELGYSEHIVNLDCSKIDTWEFRDRKSFELGNIDDLAASIKHGGQCQPIVVVRPSASFKPKDDPSAQYVVIAGYRRWMACKKYKMDVLAVVRTLTFEQAITVLASENEKESVSEYSKGMFYHTLLNTQKISEQELSQRLNINLNNLQAYLAFPQVPEEIWKAIGDLSRVSAKTASVILSFVNKGPAYVKAIKSIAKKIAHGYGERRIQEAVESIVNKKASRRAKEDLDHQVTLNGKVIMNAHHGRIKFDKSLVTDPHYEDLISEIEKHVAHFAHTYLVKH